MKDFLSLDKIIQEFIKPERVSLKDRFIPNRKVLGDKVNKARRLKDMLKTEGWQEDIREKIEKSLKIGIGTLLRPSALNLSEMEIKSILSNMHAHISFVSEILYNLEEGDRAMEKLTILEKKEKARG